MFNKIKIIYGHKYANSKLLSETESNKLTPSKVRETEVKSTLRIISIKLKTSGTGKHQQTGLAMLFC